MPKRVRKLPQILGDLKVQANRVSTMVGELARVRDPTGWARMHPELWEALDRLGELELEAFRQALLSDVKGGARARLLQYLRERQGQSVSKAELRRVAGIGEWARRLRELRVEQGWPVQTDDRGQHYTLERDAPDTEIASNWKGLNAIRRLKESARNKLLQLLKSRVGKVVTREEIAYVAGIREAARRIRELDQMGWPIISERQLPALHGGSYMLTSLERDDRPYRVPLERRLEFLRSHPTCRICGGTAGEEGRWLEVDHIVPVEQHRKADPDPNRDENLQTLCNSCHAGKTARERRRKSD